MTNHRTHRRVKLACEILESRELPAAGFLEAFDHTPPGSLPSDWSAWQSNASTAFQVTSNQGLGTAPGLTSSSVGSDGSARAWQNDFSAADVRVSTTVHLNSLAPAQVFVRGQNLDTDSPSYYAVGVTRGLQLELLRVVAGQQTTLATLSSTSYQSDTWARVTLVARGDVLSVEVFRTDTAQYLNAAGQWQTTETYAIQQTDSSLRDAGKVGLNRPALQAGTVAFANFSADDTPPATSVVPLHEEAFGATAAGALPSGWSQYSAGQGSGAQVATGRGLTGASSLSASGQSDGVVRTWLDSDVPADARISAAVYLDSLVPAQLFARGQNLSADTPSYYAVSVTRGLEVQLLRVVDGQATVLNTLDSADYFSAQWVQVTFSLHGDRLQVQVYRTDTAQYLDGNGQWQIQPAWAIDTRDATIRAGGKVGLGRPALYAGSVSFDNFVVATDPSTPVASGTTPAGPQQYPFDNVPAGTLPAGWTQWSNNFRAGFVVGSVAAIGQPAALIATGDSDMATRAWVSAPTTPDVQASAAVYLDSLVPAQVFVRGQNLDTATPSYYAANIIRGTEVQLLRVQGGNVTVLGTLDSLDWLSNQWAQVTLTATGDTLQVQVQRADTKQYLNAAGQWQDGSAIALQTTDDALSGTGYAGLARPALYNGRVLFDNFSVLNNAIQLPSDPPPAPPPPSAPPPSDPTSSAPTPGDPPPGTTPPVTTPTQPTPPVVPPVVTPPATPGTPATVPQHYSHIRLAELAYSGTPMTDFENNLLRNSVDLVVPNPSYLNAIHNVAPTTPQLIYSNVSNIYQNLLTDWLTYADQNGLAREEAFFHVSQATPFQGDSASSQPVNWFWGVARGSDGGTWTDLTVAAHKGNAPVAFGAAGQSLAVGYTEKFGEVNVSLTKSAGGGWGGVWEYATAADANGQPTAWAPLTLNGDSTAGLTRSGTLTFDPPSNWVPASVNGSARLYYVRFRTTQDGTAPVARTVLGRDYVGANGRTAGVIPAYDSSADVGNKGYLTAAEYAHRRPGFDAKFVYESRLFYPAYGQMRFATNPSDAGFQNWAVDYETRYLNQYPTAGGLLLDNSRGSSPAQAAGVLESVATYSADYAKMLAAINRQIAPRWVLANTDNGPGVNAIAQQQVSHMDEFAIRPTSSTFQQFEDLAAIVAQWESLGGSSTATILDTYPGTASVNDPRVQLGELASYYLLANPQNTFLMLNGGYGPATSWKQHWFGAVAYNVGQPTDDFSVFATGTDPGNPSLTYKVYQRDYENALVLFKPLSYKLGKGTGTTLNATATTHYLNGVYRPLNADGTLGAPTSRITLRNGEGAVLIKV